MSTLSYRYFNTNKKIVDIEGNFNFTVPDLFNQNNFYRIIDDATINLPPYSEIRDFILEYDSVDVQELTSKSYVFGFVLHNRTSESFYEVIPGLGGFTPLSAEGSTGSHLTIRVGVNGFGYFLSVSNTLSICHSNSNT
jgi:hypothetical protein